MRVSPASVATDALTLFRRDHALLIAVAGPFWFLPAFALALLIPPAPARIGGDGEATLTWMEAYGGWLRAEAHWYLLAWAIGLLGTATVYRLYLDEPRPDLRGALSGGLALWPRLALMSALAALIAGAGLLLWVLPGLYLLGRLLPAGAALTAERPLSGAGAIGRAFRLTRGNGLALTVVAAATLGAGWLLGQPFFLLDAWMRAQGGGNPVAIALVDAGAAVVSAAAALASALLSIAAYRRLAR